MPTLVNWLWQGAVVAAVTLLALDRLPRLSATTRYRILCLALVGVLAIPMLAAFRSAAAAPPGVLDVSPVLDAPATIEVAALATPDWVGRLLVAGWGIWFALGLWRLGAALVHVRRLRRLARPFPIDHEQRLGHWPALRERGRPATLVLCDGVPAVSVLGIGTPLIAVSAQALAALDDEALDQVLLHEWAHVQRRDDIARIAQALMRAVAGFHPAVRVLERRLEIEREVACDDGAANATGDPRRLAESLTRLASLASVPVLTLAPGALSASALTTRVVRLLDRRRNRSTGTAPAALAAGAVAIAGLSLALVGIRLEAADVTEARLRDASVPVALNAGEPIALPAAASSTAEGPPAAVQSPASDPADARPDSPVERAVPAPAVASRVTTPHAPALTRLPRQAWTPELDLPPPAPGSALRPDGAVLVEPIVEDEAGDDASPWSAAADAGKAIGRSSQKAGTSTGRFFTGLGLRIAGRK